MGFSYQNVSAMRINKVFRCVDVQRENSFVLTGFISLSGRTQFPKEMNTPRDCF